MLLLVIFFFLLQILKVLELGWAVIFQCNIHTFWSNSRFYLLYPSTFAYLPVSGPIPATPTSSFEFERLEQGVHHHLRLWNSSNSTVILLFTFFLHQTSKSGQSSHPKIEFENNELFLSLSNSFSNCNHLRRSIEKVHRTLKWATMIEHFRKSHHSKSLCDVVAHKKQLKSGFKWII